MQRPLPRALLDVELTLERVLPRYLTLRDRVWVQDAQERIAARVGCRRDEVEARLRSGPGWGERPLAWRALTQLLLRQQGFELRHEGPPPAELRRAVFRAAAELRAQPGWRKDALTRVSQAPSLMPPRTPARTPARTSALTSARTSALTPALTPARTSARTPARTSTRTSALTPARTSARTPARTSALTPAMIEENLLADLPERRRLRGPMLALAPEELIERYNLALVQGLLCQAERVELHLQEQVKAVLREARLRQLLVVAQVDRAAAVDAPATRLHLSGPLALFRGTQRYGRALAQWLPVVTTLRGRWELTATLRLQGRRVQLVLTEADPLATSRALPRRFDSGVEAKLFADLGRAAGGERWQVLREADPVQLGRRIVCPDFVLVERATGRRVSVEVVGYWTPAYLRDKIALLAKLPTDERWLLCVDESLAAEVGDALPDASVLPYRKRIDAGDLLKCLQEEPAE